MSETRDALYSRESHPHTGDLRVDPKASPDIKVPDVKLPRRKLGGGNRSGIMTGPGLFNPIPKEPENVVDNSSERTKKERGRRVHPYNISKGTATWSGPYGKDGTIRLGDIPVDVKAYPADKTAYSGALTFTVEVDSPPEHRGKRFKIAKPIKKGSGWYR